MRRGGCIASCWGNRREGDHWGDLGVDGWIILGELSDLYSSPNIVLVIKSRGMSWAGHVVRMGEEWVVYRVLVGKPEGKRPLGRPSVDGWIILGKLSDYSV